MASSEKIQWAALDLSAVPERVQMALAVIAAASGVTVADVVAQCVLKAARSSFVAETARAVEVKQPNRLVV